MNKVDTLGGLKPQSQQTTANTNAIGSNPDTNSTGVGDPRAATTSISLSDTAQEISSLEIRLRALSGINLERVEAIREAISSGDYSVDADEVVAGLLSSERAQSTL
jgi:flagellar biosynthesis anti-sigma factor FlgM